MDGQDVASDLTDRLARLSKSGDEQVCCVLNVPVKSSNSSYPARRLYFNTHGFGDVSCLRRHSRTHTQGCVPGRHQRERKGLAGRSHLYRTAPTVPQIPCRIPCKYYQRFSLHMTRLRMILFHSSESAGAQERSSLLLKRLPSSCMQRLRTNKKTASQRC
jgi:hypothetical protein